MPVCRQIAGQLREAILRGRLRPGALLPASRTLAIDLGVSRTTSLHAYEQLVAEGFLEARRGSGTRISARLGSDDSVDEAFTRTFPGSGAAHHDAAPERRDIFFDPEPPVAAFQPGIPAFDTFPRSRWARLLQRHGRRGDQFILDYAHPGGYGPLRQAIARYLVSSRGLQCSAEQLVIVSSARAAVSVACAVLLPPGSAAVVEDPGYNTGRSCLEAAGAAIVAVSVDGRGLRVDDPAMRAPAVRLVYTTPAHQWPTGVTLSAPRRLRLLEWAHRQNAWIIEDDYDSEFRYSSPPVATLHSLADGERVVYVGTFSKTLVPSIRCAYLVVPRRRREVFAEAAFKRGCEPSLHVQAALSDFIDEGHFARYIVRMRKVYRRRRDRLASALRASFGGLVDIALPDGGLQLVASLPATLPAREVSVRAARADLVARDIAVYYRASPAPNALHLGFGAVTEGEIDGAVERLRDAVSDLACARSVGPSR